MPEPSDTPDPAPRFDVDGQVALVTGAARGLGRACALALAQAGADVALGLRDASADGGAGREIAALGRRALPLQMDVTRIEQIAPRSPRPTARSAASTSWSTTPARPGEPGRGRASRRTSTAPSAVNLKGTFFVSQAVGRVMIRQGAGGS